MHPVIRRNLDSLHDLLLRSVPMGLVLQDRDLRILTCNDAAKRMLDLAGAVLGNSSLRLVPDVVDGEGRPLPDEQRPTRIAVRERCDVHGALVGVRRPDSDERTWIELDVSVHLDEQGEVDLLLSALNDVTVARAREEENRLLSMVAQHTDNAVVLTDAARRVQWANRAFEDLTGWSLDEVRGRKPGDLLQGAGTDPRTVARMRARLEAGQGFREEVLNYHRDGRPMWVDLEVRPLLDERGRLGQWMAIKRDVSQRRAFEESLLRHEAELGARAAELQASLERAHVLALEAERADRAKSAFLRNMNHEVRTPLNGLLGGCSLLEETELDDEQSDYLRLVTDSADRLARTLGLALDFASQESLHGDLQAQPFTLDDVLRPLTLAHRRRIEARGLEFRLRRTPNADVRVIGDAPRVRQVLAQLLDNALAFTSYGWIELGASLDGDGVTRSMRFWVEDTGCGIAVQDRDRVFQAFEQGDSSTTRPHEGVGLGLSVARRLVVRMGGQIRIVESTRGGARLEIDLEHPVAVPPTLPEPAPV